MITLSNKDLLIEAFKNLHLNAVNGGLKAIVLSVQGRDNSDIMPPEKIRDWKLVWQTASQTFEIVCQALADSPLRVQKLDVFTSITRCSLACNKLAPVLGYKNISNALAKLTCVSLSLSHHLEDNPENETIDSMRLGQRYVNDIRRFLELCPYLGTLELHWCRLQPQTEQNEAQIEEGRFFTEIAKLDNLCYLQNCQLYGIHTDEAALLAFFKQTTQLRSLTMEEIDLEEGKFASVFSCLTNQLPNLSYIHLADLYETCRICFNDPGRPSLPFTSRTNGPDTITRTGVACQRPIGYRFLKGQLVDCAEVMRWYRKRCLLYGPRD